MKKIIYTLSLLLMPAILTNCMSDSEFDKINEKLNQNSADIKPLEDKLTAIRTEFNSLTTLYKGLDEKFIVKSIDTNADGTYTLNYTNGDKVTLRQSKNPKVEIKDDGTIWIDGNSTGLKKVDGMDASISLTIDNATGKYLLNYTVKGVLTVVETNVMPTKGKPGDDQKVEITPEGDYKVNGVTIPSTNLKPTDGYAPELSFVNKDGKSLMIIKAKDGSTQEFDVTPLKGDKGDQGLAGANGEEIQSIIIEGYKLGFTFPGQATKYIEFVPQPLILDVVAPVDFSIAAPTQTINFKLLSQSATLNATVELYRIPTGWNVKVNKTSATEGSVEITATTDAVNGPLMLMAIDDKNNNYMKRVELKYVP